MIIAIQTQTADIDFEILSKFPPPGYVYGILLFVPYYPISEEKD